MKIRARISAKLKDRSGASITYALLLFLVCAVVSSVVLAAGTAASGRMSKAVETDQRYYAVTSAAGYLRKMIEGKSVKVVKKNVSTAGSTETVPDGNPQMNDAVYNEGSLDLLTEAAAYYTKLKSAGATETSVTRENISMLVGSEASPEASLTVSINEKLDTVSGKITLTLKNTEGDPYSITMVFDPDIKETVDSKTENNVNDAGVITTTRTVTETTKMTWSLSRIG